MNARAWTLMTWCLLAGAASAGDYAQWRGGPGRTGLAADPAAVFVKPTGIALEEAWKVPMPGEKFGNHSSAVVSGGKVYAHVNRSTKPEDPKHRERVEEIVCVDLADGTLAWRKELGRGPRQTFHNTPCVGDGLVVVLLSDGTVCALAAADGKERWRASIAPSKEFLAAKKAENRKFRVSYNASPTMVNGKVIVGAHDLFALSAAKGEILWRQEEVSCGAGSPAIWWHDGKAYALAGGGQTCLVDLADGSVKWKVRGPVNSTPCVAGDLLAIMSPGDKQAKTKSRLAVYRLAPDKPEELYTREMKLVLQSPSTDGRRLYICTGSSRLCLDAATGKQVWSGRGTMGDHYASFLVVGSTLIGWTAPHRKPMGEGESKIGFYRASDGAEIAVCDVTRLGECAFPAVCGDRIVFRGLENLWCYRVKGESK